MDALRFDSLTPRDLEGALRLSVQAGWNQTPADWRRLLDLSPGGCIAGRLAGRLAATATVVAYGARVGWIGMVLVDEAFRGRGLGTALLHEAVACAGRLGVEASGLDATDLGHPVYLKIGYSDVDPIDRWGGALRATGPARGTIPIGRRDLDAVAGLDSEACGVDRHELLSHLLSEPEVAGWVCRDDDGLHGHAFLRPGREHAHLGPVVAEDAAALRMLLAAAAPLLKGRTVLIDAPRDPATSGALSAAGLEVRRRLTRMTRPRAVPLLLGERIRAVTAFEWG